MSAVNGYLTYCALCHLIRCYLAVLNCELNSRICYLIGLVAYCELIACFFKGVGAVLKSYLLSHVAGSPCLNDLALAVLDSQLSACELVLAVDLLLGNCYYCIACSGIFNEKHAVSVYLGSLGSYLTVSTDSKVSICCYVVALGSNCLTECVSNARLKADYLVSCLCGIPLVNYCSTLKHLNVSALNFLTVCDIYLRYLNGSLAILNKDSAVSCCLSGCCYLAVCAYCECCVCSYCVAFGSNCLTESICNTSLKTCDLLCGCARLPFLNDCLTFEYLECSACYFLLVGDIDLGYLYRGHIILNEENAALCYRACRCYLSFFINSKGSICSYCIAFGSNCLTESISNARLKACDLVSLICRYPFINSLAVFVEYLDSSALELFAVCNIYLRY